MVLGVGLLPTRYALWPAFASSIAPTLTPENECGSEALRPTPLLTCSNGFNQWRDFAPDVLLSRLFRVSAAQAAGAHCAPSEFSVGTTTYRMQFLSEGRYVANVVDGKVNLYRR
jgi:hypothetical protein